MGRAIVVLGTILSLLLILTVFINLEHSIAGSLFVEHGENIKNSGDPQTAMKHEEEKLKDFGFKDIHIELAMVDDSISVVTLSAKKTSLLLSIFGDVDSEYKYVWQESKGGN